MPHSRFNQVFAFLVIVALVGALLIPPSVTARADGKADLLLVPIAKPARAIANLFHRKYGHKPLPPGETVPPTDQQLAAENIDLKQQVVFLNRQLEDLRLVEEERKRLGKLIDYFKPVGVVGGDASPGRESLSLMLASGVTFAANTPVMCPDGLVGRITEGRRVRLITDPGYKITGAFGRWEKNVWNPVTTPKAACTGIGNGTIRIDNLTLKEAEVIKPDDWVIVNDTDYPDIMQGRPLAKVETVRPIPAKPLFAEIIARPRKDLLKLREVLVMRK
jgi:hypothetical protein